MKIININKKIDPPILIPSVNIDYDRYDEMIDSIVALIHEEIDKWAEQNRDEEVSVPIKAAIRNFENSLWGKQLVKQMHVDKYYFKFLEEYFISCVM